MESYLFHDRSWGVSRQPVPSQNTSSLTVTCNTLRQFVPHFVRSSPSVRNLIGLSFPIGLFEMVTLLKATFRFVPVLTRNTQREEELSEMLCREPNLNFHHRTWSIAPCDRPTSHGLPLSEIATGLMRPGRCVGEPVPTHSVQFLWVFRSDHSGASRRQAVIVVIDVLAHLWVQTRVPPHRTPHGWLNHIGMSIH